MAAVVKDSGKWTIAVDGEPWSSVFDMIWDPVFSPDGEYVAAKALLNKEYFVVVNGKVATMGCTDLWPLVFSPDGSKLLIKALELGLFQRKIISVKDLIR